MMIQKFLVMIPMKKKTDSNEERFDEEENSIKY